MHRLAVGEFYNPAKQRWPEVTQYNFRGGQHELVLFMNGITPEELAAYRSLPLKLGFTYQSGVVNLLWKPTGAGWSDSPYSPWALPTSAERVAPEVDLSHEVRALLQVVLVSANDGIVRVLRAVTMSPAMTRELHKAIAEQMASPMSIEAYHAAVGDIYRRFPTTDALVERAIVTCNAGE